MSKRAVLAKVKEIRPDGSAVLEPLVDLATWRGLLLKDRPLKDREFIVAPHPPPGAPYPKDKP